MQFSSGFSVPEADPPLAGYPVPEADPPLVEKNGVS